jgi:hypothetical protein
MHYVFNAKAAKEREGYEPQRKKRFKSDSTVWSYCDLRSDFLFLAFFKVAEKS